MDRKKKAIQDFDEINDELAKYYLKGTFFSSITNPSTRFVNNIVYAGVAISGGLVAIMTGGITVGGLATILSYANQYTKPFNEISGVVTELQNAIACGAKIFSLINQEKEIDVEESENQLQNIEAGRVDINDVDFSYVPDRKLIENLNLHVKPGQRIAIVGPTGCGKTTIINLLTRFYDVDKGSITIDGKRYTRHIKKEFKKLLWNGSSGNMA